jgi:hypothetical protein
VVIDMGGLSTARDYSRTVEHYIVDIDMGGLSTEHFL